MIFDVVIGLEIHARLNTKTKIFCSCPLNADAPPNQNICPICAGLPGALPSLNESAVQLAVRTSTALKCDIHHESTFARKNYFYPDLPKGYQITQYESPLATAGHLQIQTENGPKSVRIQRIHLEEDAGKSIHTGQSTRVDLGRAGAPLLEIVTEPDLATPDEAADFASDLRRILMYLGVCDGNMEHGSYRMDGNLSLKPKGSKALGIKVEIKNVNSFGFLRQALRFEVQRQTQALLNGESVDSETRSFDEKTKETFTMRDKEGDVDYRYFPEPDLPQLIIDPDLIAEELESLLELPASKMARFVDDFGLDPSEAAVLTSSERLAEYFEFVAVELSKPGLASSFITGEVLRVAPGDEQGFCPPVTAEDLAALLLLVERKKISYTAAKRVFKIMLTTDKNPRDIIEEQRLEQISDEQAIEPVVRQVLAQNDSQAYEYQSGKKQLFGFFVGKVMKATGGAAKPVLVNNILKRLLDEEDG